MTVPPGVTFLDHTADVGVALEAPSLETLFDRAALGMLALLRGDEEPDADGEPAGVRSPRPAESPSSWSTLELEAGTPAALLADWLRELLFLHDVEHRDYLEADFRRLEPDRLRARVRTEPASGAVREIKGVTYHELAMEEGAEGWRARVIFDV